MIYVEWGSEKWSRWEGHLYLLERGWLRLIPKKQRELGPRLYIDKCGLAALRPSLVRTRRYLTVVLYFQQISKSNLHRLKKAWTLELEKDGNITNKRKRVIIISILSISILVKWIKSSKLLNGRGAETDCSSARWNGGKKANSLVCVVSCGFIISQSYNYLLL